MERCTLGLADDGPFIDHIQPNYQSANANRLKRVHASLQEWVCGCDPSGYKATGLQLEHDADAVIPSRALKASPLWQHLSRFCAMREASRSVVIAAIKDPISHYMSVVSHLIVDTLSLRLAGARFYISLSVGSKCLRRKITRIPAADCRYLHILLSGVQQMTDICGILNRLWNWAKRLRGISRKLMPFGKPLNRNGTEK